jgi:surfactin synthase thioesterase subunit
MPSAKGPFFFRRNARGKRCFLPNGGRDKNRREKLIMDILSLVQGLFPTTRMKKKENSIALIFSF